MSGNTYWESIKAEGGQILERLKGRDAHAEILRASMEMKPDLVVIGTHGRSGFQRLVLGSVTEKVLRRAPCPVLSVPPRAAESASPVVYKRILCPVDFSDSSLTALQYATFACRGRQGKPYPPIATRKLTAAYAERGAFPRETPIFTGEVSWAILRPPGAEPVAAPPHGSWGRKG